MLFYGYCVIRKTGEKIEYLTGMYSPKINGLKLILTENKNLAYLYDTTEKAQLIAGQLEKIFPGLTVEEFHK